MTRDTIDRQAVISLLERLGIDKFSVEEWYQFYINALIDVENGIKEQPTIEQERCKFYDVESHYCTLNRTSAQPAQKIGHWVPIDDEPHEEYECDRCGYISCSTFGPGGIEGTRYNYCPECGAKMEAKE